MIKIKQRTIRLEGKYVVLEEVQPKYFPYIIEWRNNPENNRFLNQPFKLTMELQTKWYEEKYLNDFSQGLFVMVDKANDVPFGTIGWTDYDASERICIAGRLLVGNLLYRGSLEWEEAAKLANDYLYNSLYVDNVYAHVVKENVAAIKWHEKWGYIKILKFKFPDEKNVNGMEQIEFIKNRFTYEEIVKVKFK